MPLYEYECRGCQARVERRQHFNDEPLKVCPTCGGDMRRLLYPAGIIFKGSGWYSTDSRPTQVEPVSSSSSSSSSSSTSSTSSTASAASSSSSPSTPSSSGGDKKAASNGSSGKS